jgi:hypothetical protein
MANIRITGAAVLLAAAAVSLHASSPRFFQAATQPEFLKGEVQNLSVDNRGQLALGPATELVYETPAPFLWALLPAADGSIYVGTGNEGKVFRVDAQGKAAPFFDASELEVHALATAPNGGLYVGTSPNGKIYKVDRNGASTVFFDPGEKYIWALATDAQGNVYAATGEKGIVYKIAPDGKGAAFYRSKATHVTALTFDKGGSLLVGTESPGRVLRVGADAKAFLLLDTPFEEIRAFRFDDKGTLYVAAVSGRPGGGAPSVPADTGAAPAGSSSGPVAVVTTEVSAVTVADTSTSGASNGSVSRDDKRAAKGAVYRIAPDGLWDQLWQSSDDSPYDLVFDAQGRVVIATGNKGKIYRLEGDPPQPTLLTRASAQQVTALYKDAKGQLYYATANPGKLYRLSSDLAPQGTYESEPHDAQVVSSWGVIKWRGTFPAGTKTEIATRSGNTETPDETWSDWSAAYPTPDGSAISSPKARFLQWRAVLSAMSGRGQSPILTSVTAAYLQRNLRPEVHSVTVHPPGIVFQKPFSNGDPDLAGFDNQTTPDRKLTNAAMSPQSGSGSASLGRRTYQKGLQTLVWRADDENEDDLTYEVDYRLEGDTAWKVLHRDLDEPIYVWDTTTVPNGTYFVKIIASDAPSNAAGTALTGELVSAAFEVDNTPPEIVVRGTRVNGGKTIITFDVTDDHSHIQRVEYSEDGQDWKAVFPADGIADSRQEHYELALDGTIGPRGLSLRASDSMNNVATHQVDR